MPKASPIQTNFTGGEWSPQLDGRVDLGKYANACREMRNFIATPHGPARRRAGTRFVAPVKDSAKRAALIPFEFSITQAYVIEAGDLYFRFYRDNGRIEDPPGTPFEIATPYAEADLFDGDGRLRLKFAQSADVLYLVHPAYKPRKLTRTGHTAWTLTAIDFKDGPYLALNVTFNKLAASSGAGRDTGTGAPASVTVTSDSTIGINNGAGFLATDVGRTIRIEDNGNWGWGAITAVGGPQQVTVDVWSTQGFPTVGTRDWRLGVWSDTTGWPAAVTFFEERLCFAGPTDHPQRLDMSRTGDFETFAPSQKDGTVLATHAIALTLNANNVNVIRWLIDDEKGLECGTVGGEWIIRAAATNEGVAPDNVSAKRSSNFGSADLMPHKAGRSTLYLQRAGRRVRELAFVFEDDGFRSPDMTLLAEHITAGGLIALALQREPAPVLWAVRADGVLLGLTFEREQEVVAWHRHVLGGFSDATQSQPAVCESVAVIPSSDGARDETWLVVRRRIAGADVRFVEYIDERWDGSDAAGAFFVDSGLSYEGPAVTAISGLDHLEGETVAILADGAVVADQVVAAGSITLDAPAMIVHAGLPYLSRLETLRLEAGAADGTAQGKTKRIHRVVLRFDCSLGVRAGPDRDRLDPVPLLAFRDPSTPMGSPEPLFTGDAEITWPGGYERAARVVVEAAMPLPCTLVAIMPQVITQDR